MTGTLAGVEGASAEWGNMSSAFIGYSGQQSGQIEAAMARIKGFPLKRPSPGPRKKRSIRTPTCSPNARLMALTLRLRAGAVKVEAARGLSDAAQSLQYTTFWEYTP